VQVGVQHREMVLMMDFYDYQQVEEVIQIPKRHLI
jgi:hypothetical protein